MLTTGDFPRHDFFGGNFPFFNIIITMPINKISLRCAIGIFDRRPIKTVLITMLKPIFMTGPVGSRGAIKAMISLLTIIPSFAIRGFFKICPTPQRFIIIFVSFFKNLRGKVCTKLFFCSNQIIQFIKFLSLTGINLQTISAFCKKVFLFMILEFFMPIMKLIFFIFRVGSFWNKDNKRISWFVIKFISIVIIAASGAPCGPFRAFIPS